VLRLTPLRVDDGRRNVVHVLGAHEARQWRLPVVFVCGLVEKQFPKFHTQDPFFPEAARAQLKQAGIRLRTAADFEAEERFLFDWAVTRATELLTLSYPQCDARGQQNLRSLYLDGVGAPRVRGNPCCRSRAGNAAPCGRRPSSPAPIFWRAWRSGTSRSGRGARIVFAVCVPVLWPLHSAFARGPGAAGKRLDFLTQGIVVHAVLAELHGNPRPLARSLRRVFARVCEERRVPAGYRTEACRERMLADLRALVEDPGWMQGHEIRTEQKFRYKLGADVEIGGRIDRIDVAPNGGAYVIDYKYSGAQNTKSLGDQ
jgi:hypothetical protein